MIFLGILIVLPIVLPIFLLVSYYLGRLLLRPLAEQSPAPPRVQFLITDMYALIAQLMLIGSLIFGGSESGVRDKRLLVMFGAWAVLGWWWWLGVRRLSRAGIFHAWRRAVFLAIAVPFAFGNFFLLVLLIPFAEDSSALKIRFLGLLLVILFMSFSGCRRLAEWAAAAKEANR